jgi:hypothetical protein
MGPQAVTIAASEQLIGREISGLPFAAGAERCESLLLRIRLLNACTPPFS